MSKRIPDRWLNYSAIGDVIAHTNFVAFKVPLHKVSINKTFSWENHAKHCDTIFKHFKSKDISRKGRKRDCTMGEEILRSAPCDYNLKHYLIVTPLLTYFTNDNLSIVYLVNGVFSSFSRLSC